MSTDRAPRGRGDHPSQMSNFAAQVSGTPQARG